MMRNRSKSVLAVGMLALVLGGPAAAQDLEEMQLFAPSDLSTYGSGPQPKQGYFFGFDGLVWSISKPNNVPIGFPGISRSVYVGSSIWEVQTNDMDTGTMTSEFTEGNRIEFGRVTDRGGWLVSTYRLNDQVQRFGGQNVDMVLFDPEHRIRGHVSNFLGYDDDTPLYSVPFVLADLPITFDELLVDNRVETWGVEVMYMVRLGQVHRGGFIELFFGARYMELDETFSVTALGNERFNADDPPASVDGIANARYDFDLGPDNDPTETNWSPIGPGVVLADSNWFTEAENHIIGPQLGGRWHRKNGRWSLSAEGRFFAGLNMQNIRNKGVLGSELNTPPSLALEALEIDPGPPPVLLAYPGFPYLPLIREPYAFDNSAHVRKWSPGGELRVDVVFELTRSISVKAGWTGMWLGGIARGSAMPDYVISNTNVMEINRHSDQNVFVNGVNFGITVNR